MRWTFAARSQERSRSARKSRLGTEAVPLYRVRVERCAWQSERRRHGPVAVAPRIPPAGRLRSTKAATIRIRQKGVGRSRLGVDCRIQRPSATEARTSAPYKLESFPATAPRADLKKRYPMQSVHTGALRAGKVDDSADPRVLWREQVKDSRERARLLCEQSKLLREECQRTRAKARSTRALLESSRRAIGVSRTLLVLAKA